MPLSDAEYVELQTILQGLEGELSNLYQSARGFVSDQIERERQYGQDIRISPKQWKWLRDLYEEKVGTLPGPKIAGKMTDGELETDHGRRAGKALRDDLDDDMPF